MESYVNWRFGNLNGLRQADFLAPKSLTAMITFRLQRTFTYNQQLASNLFVRCNGVFTLPDSDADADFYTDSHDNGLLVNVQRCLHWTYSNSYSDADGYCTQFGTDISTDKVVFKTDFHCYFASESS